MRRCVVTGIGTISALGHNTNSFWQTCLEGKANIEPIPSDWSRYWPVKSKWWSPLNLPDYKSLGFKSADLFQFDAVTLNSLLATTEAIANAKLTTQVGKDEKNFVINDAPSERIGVFYGTGSAGVSSFLENHTHQILHPLKKAILDLELRIGGTDLQDAIEQIKQELAYLRVGRMNPLVLVKTMINAPAAAVSLRFGITGPTSITCVACASGTVAIGRAYKSIMDGECDLAITGGSEYLEEQTGAFFRSFDELRTLTTCVGDPATVNRPFDQNRSGFLFSQGGACSLVLEEYEHAVARGATIIAEIAGFEETFDAHSMVSIQPEGTEIKRMLNRLLDKAGVSAQEIDYINAHGTGTQVNDETECHVIDSLFGEKPAINSTKSILGHSLGASGALEAAVTALSIHHNKLHASLNIDSPIKDLNFVKEARTEKIELAISQSFAFGGHNAALLFKSA